MVSLKSPGTKKARRITDDYDFFNLDEQTVDDWRFARVRHLGLFFLDRQLVEQEAALVAAQAELDDSVALVRETKRRMESKGGQVRKGIDGKNIPEDATTKDEREAARDAIVQSDQDYQSRRRAYEEAVSMREKAQAALDYADMQIKDTRMRLNWRTHLLSFMGTIKPIALDRIPDENGDIPALQKKRQNDAPMEMNQQTRDWLDAMANRQVRYGPVGKLALEVLPEGVQGDHPEVRSMLKDIERGPSAKKQVSL